MQRDKATLSYHGKPQVQWAYELLSEFCAATFVSVRPDQRDEPTRAGLPQIVDLRPGIGPVAGISAALMQHPKAAWLVVACDLPFLTAATLEHLIAHRDPQRIATAYRSAHDGLPEPLCAIWEPAAREPLLAYVDAGKQCPRKFLINANTQLLDLPNATALDNVNTPQELSAAQETLGSTDPLTRASHDLFRTGRGKEATIGFAPSPAVGEGWGEGSANRKAIRVQYYALFREQAGRSEETLETTASTPGALYRELQSRYPFKLAQQQLKVAINNDFANWDAHLTTGDTVVFIPPVAGG
jgi:molybdopterin-guanine dinucleotide biosynthesis protein A